MDFLTSPPWFQRLDFESELMKEIGLGSSGSDIVSIILLTPRMTSRLAARSLYRVANAVLTETGGFSGLLGDGDCVLCLPRTTREEADALAQIIGDLMGAESVSFGVAAFPGDGSSLAELLSAARSNVALRSLSGPAPQ